MVKSHSAHRASGSAMGSLDQVRGQFVRIARGTLSQRSLIIAACSVLFCLAFLLYTYNNRYPIYPGFDETSKVQQIVDGTRNFHHPLLLINAVDKLRVFLRDESNPNSILRLGRTWSAAAMALAVVLTSLAVYLYHGPIAASLVGLFLVLNPDLYSIAHRFKEDASLLLGLSLFLFSSAFYWKRPTWGRICLLAVSCAFAASAKHVGLLTVPIAVGMLLFASRERLYPLLIYFVVFILSYLVVNYQIVSSLAATARAFQYEVGVVSEGRSGDRQKTLNDFVLRKFSERATALGAALLVACFIIPIFTRNFRFTPPIWTVLIFAIVYGTLLSMSAQLYGRYYAPLAYALSFFSAFGVYWIAYSSSTKALRPVLCVLLAVAFAYPSMRLLFAEVPRKEKRDERRELARFIQNHIPSDALIAYDATVFLPDPRHSARNPHQLALSQRVFTLDWELPIALAGSIDELRTKGITHVAVSVASYAKYFQPRRRQDSASDKIRQFYSTLRTGEKVLWHSASTVRIGDTRFPKFALYDISAPFVAQPNR